MAGTPPFWRPDSSARRGCFLWFLPYHKPTETKRLTAAEFRYINQDS